jgi:hypothetical protein
MQKIPVTQPKFKFEVLQWYVISRIGREDEVVFNENRGNDMMPNVLPETSTKYANTSLLQERGVH